PSRTRSPRSWRTCRPSGSWRSRPPGPGRRNRPGATPPGRDTVPRTVPPPEDQPEGIPIMKGGVIGGTGLIGSERGTKLGHPGHQAGPAAPETGVDTLTGEGLTEVLKDASVVVDVSNSPSFADDDVMHFFRTSTTHLLRAEAGAGVAHHVVLSVVGTERLQESGYFRAKQAQEELVRASGIPFSIVHATQFFEFLKGITDAATDG